MILYYQDSLDSPTFVPTMPSGHIYRLTYIAHGTRVRILTDTACGIQIHVRWKGQRKV